MKKIILVLTIIFTMPNVILVSANEIPRESAPLCATEEQIILTENLMADILIEVQNGMGYAEAKAKSSRIIFNAVISDQTNGNGFGILSAIANNAIFHYRDMYLRPEFYAENESKVKIIIADVITQYANGELDYPTAVKKSYEKLYQSVNTSFNYDEEFSKDSCYRDIPAVNGSLFTIARKLLIEEKTVM